MKQIIALVSLALLPFSQVAAEGFQVNAQSTKQTCRIEMHTFCA